MSDSGILETTVTENDVEQGALETAPADIVPISSAQPVEEVNAAQAIDPWKSDSSEPSDLSIGFVDNIYDGAIHGWCYSGIQGAFQTVNVFVDGNLVAEIVADQYRSDLEKAGLNSGLCGYIWKIAEELRDDRDHLIAVFTASGKELEHSPIRIRGSRPTVGASDQAESALAVEQVDLSNVFVNPQLADVSNQRVRLAKGANPVGEGWEIYAASDDVGQLSYWPSVMELYGSDLVASALRIKSAKPVSMARLFGALKKPGCFFFLPFNLKFHFGNLSNSHPVALAVRLGTKTDDGKFDTHYKTVITQGAGMSGDVSVTIPADMINNVVRQNGVTPSVVFEFAGHVNVELGRFSLGIQDRSLQLVPEITGCFEDPVIEDQYAAIEGFFDAGASAPVESKTPVWRSWPGQQLPEVVVPVYDALEHVQLCLQSVVESTECPHLLTIVDDGSLPECATWLDEFAKGKPWVRVLHNGGNLGYTRAINRAIRESTGSAIILLNSDTIVSPGWLTRLIAVAESDPTTGLVGPVSNAASWQSVPAIKDKSGAWAINALPPNTTVSEYAELVRASSTGESAPVPILNGFCLYIKRKVFDTIGLFDEEAFPQGYGEENDFCFRAADAGFELRVATDAYVFHAKTKSFGTQRREGLIKTANEILHQRYGKERFSQLEAALSKLPALEHVRNHLMNMTVNEENSHG